MELAIVQLLVLKTLLCKPLLYIADVLPLMRSPWFFGISGVVAVAPFSHRLASNELPYEIQRLRCKVNFEALRSVPSIDHLGNILVDRLQNSQARKVDGDAGKQKYLARLHLRFDKIAWQRLLCLSVDLHHVQTFQLVLLDMAAHSACSRLNSRLLKDCSTVRTSREQDLCELIRGQIQ